MSRPSGRSLRRRADRRIPGVQRRRPLDPANGIARLQLASKILSPVRINPIALHRSPVHAEQFNRSSPRRHLAHGESPSRPVAVYSSGKMPPIPASFAAPPSNEADRRCEQPMVGG
jgi:hypothetical protein